MYNLIFLYYGLLAILTQLVAFRELSVLFYGNELFLGTFLSSWFFWVGLGSLLARRLLKKKHSPPAAYLSYAFLTVSLLFPAMILLIRVSKGIFAFGEFIGPIGTILYTFSVMSLLCFVIGGQFSLACEVASEKVKKETALGRVYLLEALGAVIGGALFTYVLIGSVPTFIIALALSLSCVLVSIGLLINHFPPRRWKNIFFHLRGGNKVNVVLIALALAVLFAYFIVEPVINRIEWKGYQFIRQKEARNSTLSLVKMGSIKNVFVDGILSASFPGPESYEPAAHWPLLASAKLDRILIIGDASLGLLKEALKHKPEKIDYVVLDNSFLAFVGPYLESEDILALKDPAVNIHYVDSRIFVRENKDAYDAVIINIQEVPNLKTNRLYTKEFYSRIRSVLKPNGIFALSATSSENYLSMRTRLFNASLYFSLKSAFWTVEVIPGDTITFLASSSTIDMRKDTILGRFNDRKISNHYFIPSYIEYKLETARRAELKKLLEETGRAEINTDFRPTTCYYFANFWLNKFASPLEYLVWGILAIALILVMFKKRALLLFPAVKKEAVLIFVLGFTGILLELVLLLGYQIISGYVYWQMGVLFASFMSGLFLGSFSGNQFKRGSSQAYSVALIILSLVITGLSVYAASSLPRLIYLSAALNIVIFMALLALTGAIVGAAFVIAGFLISEKDLMAKAGSLYAADLWGSSLGAMLSTNFIVPVFGILGALNFSAVIALAGLAVFLILSRKVST